MKTIQVTFFVENEDFEKRITNLEERCTKLEISLPQIYQITAATMPCNPFIDILLSLSDLKISDIEKSKKIKRFWNKFKINKKGKEHGK